MPPQKPERTTPGDAPAASAAASRAGAARATEASAEQSSLQPLEGKRVLIAIGEFAEGMETYYLIYRVMEEGRKRLSEWATDWKRMSDGVNEILNGDLSD